MKVKVKDITIITDTREQLPLDFSSIEGVASEIGKVYPGDYTLKGHESYVAFERKSVGDLIGTMKSGYEKFRSINRLHGRFNRELEDMRMFCPIRWLIVESSKGYPVKNARQAIADHDYQSIIEPSTVFAFLRQIQVAYQVHVYYADSRFDAARQIVDICRTYLADRKQIVPRQTNIKEK